MSPIVLSLLLGILFAVGAFLALSGLDRRRGGDEQIERALKGYGEISPVTLDQMELETPFEERVLRPALERIGKFISERTPEKSRYSLRLKLALAGNPGGLSVGGFQALRDAVAVAFIPIVALLALALFHSVIWAIVGGVVGVVVGFYAPILWLNSISDRRRSQIRKALPDAMDLLTISVEAGQSFDASIQTVVEKFHNALSDEFFTVIREVQLGRPRLEALEDMGKRSGVDDVNNFVQAIIQSEQMGVGISKILRIQAAELRRRRRQRAQEQAAQASLKMMLPMVGCIFPTLWIILLGPAVLVILKARG